MVVPRRKIHFRLVAIRMTQITGPTIRPWIIMRFPDDDDDDDDDDDRGRRRKMSTTSSPVSRRRRRRRRHRRCRRRRSASLDRARRILFCEKKERKTCYVLTFLERTFWGKTKNLTTSTWKNDMTEEMKWTAWRAQRNHMSHVDPSMSDCDVFPLSIPFYHDASKLGEDSQHSQRATSSFPHFVRVCICTGSIFLEVVWTTVKKWTERASTWNVPCLFFLLLLGY